MKRLKTLTLCLIVLLIFGMAACSNQDQTATPSDAQISSAYNGTYYGHLPGGERQKLTITGYTDQGFDFDLDQTGLIGYAQLQEDGLFYYTDPGGQSVDFDFDESSVYLNGGTRYAAFSAQYEKDE